MKALLTAVFAAFALAAVPAQAAEPSPATAAVAPPAAAASRAAVDVNRASAAELEAVPGIGPATAEAILALRAKRGGFTKLEELLEVKGIGPKKLQTLAPYLAIVPAPATTAKTVPAAK
jgi:competence protein ComEA